MNQVKSKEPQQQWSGRGSFLSKPWHGWLHPDAQLAPDVGVCYGVRYVGNLGVLESMKALDVDTRTDITKECIEKVCCAAGLKPPNKNKKNQKIDLYVATEPDLTHTATDISLTITTDSVTLIGTDDGDLLYHHLMPTISFASGGDTDTMDFVAYVAKDGSGRTCHVVECGEGLVQDIITTIGQAFELRFKTLLMEKASPLVAPERVHTPSEDYYNDRPGAVPPSPQQDFTPPSSSNGVTQAISSHYPFARANGLVPGNTTEASLNVNRDSQAGDQFALVSQFQDGEPAGNYCTPHTAMAMGSRKQDPFHMRPFNSILQNGNQSTSVQISGTGTWKNESRPTAVPVSILPYHEPWFHGKISRQKCEEFLHHDGDFLVRESPNSPGQFVLSGRHAGHIRHLLLVDPNGKVRTKDLLFTSVSHLVNHHMLNNVPIISVDSELLLRTPMMRCSD